MKAIYTRLVVRVCAIFVILVSASLVQAYSETIVVRRSLQSTTPRKAYQCAVAAWKQNLGLWFLPPAFLLNQGDPETGVGLVVMRIPPLGLREGIVDYDESAENHLRMIYKVLNPSPFTWPVSEHVGEILFRPDVNNDGDCELEWTVRWTPLAPWLPFFPETLKAITVFIIEWAASHVVKLSKDLNDGREEL